MDESEEIKALRERIEALYEAFAKQQKQIEALQKRIDLGTGNEDFISSINTKKKKTSSFELENFIGLRLIHLVGIVVLVIGLSIGVKYAIDQNLISPLTRILLTYIAVAFLYILSLSLKNKYEAFSAILFSGSMASFYFTTYAGAVYYDLMPGWLAFLVMIGLTIYTTITSLQYNRQEISILGMVGAYGIPFLISKNSDASLLFFCYIFLINSGIMLLAFKRSWKTLQLLAFFITWIIFIGWTLVRYRPSEQITGIAFMVLFYCMFLTQAFVDYFKKSMRIAKTRNSIILLDNVAAYISSLILFQTHITKAISADITGIFSVICFIMSFASRYYFITEKNLSKFLALQAITALIAYVALSRTGITITLLWLAIALILFIAGIYLNEAWPRLASIATFSLTLLKLLLFDSAKFSTIQKIFSYIIIGSLLLIVSFFYQKFKLAFFSERKEGTEK